MMRMSQQPGRRDYERVSARAPFRVGLIEGKVIEGREI
jgi:hypothetical protein